MSIPDSLNPEQKDAVASIKGPLLVLAGAGTGKTRVITCRIAHMIDTGIDPAHILGVTFTNKAAREMRERLLRIVPAELAEEVMLGTFHSVCGRILRRHIRHAGNYNSSFSIADPQDQSSIIRQAAAELGYQKEELPTPDVLSYISDCKNTMLLPSDALARDAGNPRLEHFAEVYDRYQTLLELQNTVDFDDMLLLTLRIFEHAPEVLESYRKRYEYILVDEYQDTNATQFRILQLLAGDPANLCVVGDDDQSIYAWRGADVSNILNFPLLFPGTKQIKLEQNYRSTNHILSAANAVISSNSKRYAKNLWSANGDGEPLRIVVAPSSNAEAEFVCDAIEKLRRNDPDLALSDCAVLYRSNQLSRVFEQEFRRRRIRPKIIGGQEFFQRKEVKDAAAYLKLILNDRDDQSLLRVIAIPPRGIGDKAILTLRSVAADSKSSLVRTLESLDFRKKLSAVASDSAQKLADTIRRFRNEFNDPGDLARKVRSYLAELGYLDCFQRLYRDIKEAENRRDNVFEFINYIASYEQSERDKKNVIPSLENFLENYSLMDENDRTDDDDHDGPIMSTVHSSKGLEFPCVFLVGMEKNIFPHERAILDGDEEEERRLFYVAITRAKHRLFLSYANERFKFGENAKCFPSKFLRDIPDELAIRTDPQQCFPRPSEEERNAMLDDALDFLSQINPDEDDF